MDYCKICKKKTKSTGEPEFGKSSHERSEFIIKYRRWRRISICRNCQSVKNNISKSPEDILTIELPPFNGQLRTGTDRGNPTV
jgi:hypothetical protein